MIKENNLFGDLRGFYKFYSKIIFLVTVIIGSSLAYYRSGGDIEEIKFFLLFFIFITSIISLVVYRMKPGHCPEKIGLNDKSIITINNGKKTFEIPWESIDGIKVEEFHFKGDQYYRLEIELSSNGAAEYEQSLVIKKFSRFIESLIINNDCRSNIRVSKEILNDIIEYYKDYGNGNIIR